MSFKFLFKDTLGTARYIAIDTTATQNARFGSRGKADISVIKFDIFHINK